MTTTKVQMYAMILSGILGVIGGGSSLINGSGVSTEQSRSIAQEVAEERSFSKSEGIELRGVVSSQAGSIEQLKQKLERIESQQMLIISSLSRIEAQMENRRGR